MKKKFSPSSEQIIIRLWKWCNFKCTFCNVWDNEQKIKIKESYIDILAKLNYKIYHSSIKKWDTVNFTISWWEPTLFKKELLFSLKCIKELAIKKWIIPNIDIQTNGYNIDLEYANILHKLWIDRAMLSFHTVNKQSYEKIIW
jgi:sulfatase maturation enzyme AslB (radical SAM superfamily)